MATLYLVQQGTTLHRERDRFIIDSPEGMTTEVLIRELEHILVFGAIHLTVSVISSCLQAGIPVLFLSQNGQYRGHLWSLTGGDLTTEIAQFERWQTQPFQLEMARKIVLGKVLNCKQLLLRLNRKRGIAAVKVAIAGLNSDIRTIKSADNLEALRGHEGIAAARYFPAIGQLIAPHWQFSHRTRRPPTDPINALLSFGYTLLFNNVLSLILAEGLNPHLGNLHCSDRKEPHLAFDLMEEFRSPIVDSLVLTLVNQQVIQISDFQPPNEQGGVYLLEEAKRRFLKAFEERMRTVVAHPDAATPVPYRRTIQLQIRRYKRSLLEEQPYQPFLRAV